MSLKRNSELLEPLRRALMTTMPIALCGLMATAACGPEDEEQEEELGVLGRGGECLTQLDCFACEDCRSTYGEICVDGVCWLSGEPGAEEPNGYPSVGSFNLAVELPKQVDPTTIRSAAIRVLHPLRVDGSTLTCEELLDDPVAIDDDESVNRLRVLQPGLVLQGAADVADIGVGHVPEGDARVFLVRLHSMKGGDGTLLGKGCTEGVDVLHGSGQRLVVATERLD